MGQDSDSARRILTNQPDFIGQETMFDFEPDKGGAIRMSNKIAKKGDSYRRDTSFFVFISRPNQPTLRLDPKTKTYSELPQPNGDGFLWFWNAEDVQSFAEKKKVRFQIAGREKVDDHDCLVIKATPDSKSTDEEAIYFYCAEDLKNLVIKIQLKLPNRITTYTLTNITFDVPDSLFTIPARYRHRRG